MQKQRVKTSMSVPEMGKMLGLGKVESYWLVKKNYFKTIQVAGRMRVMLDSFEDLYSYRKLMSLQSFANNSSCTSNVSFAIFVISFEFSKNRFLYRKFGDYGYLAMYANHLYVTMLLLSGATKKAGHQEH